MKEAKHQKLKHLKQRNDIADRMRIYVLKLSHITFNNTQSLPCGENPTNSVHQQIWISLYLTTLMKKKREMLNCIMKIKHNIYKVHPTQLLIRYTGVYCLQ
jgi:hypothetical protein